jgi:predicted secreted protein
MANKIEKLADDLMNLTKDEAQQLQLVIKAKLMPEVERQRGLLNDQMAQNPQMANMGKQQQMASRAATQRDVRMQGLLR